MPKSAVPETRGWLAPALIGVLAITAARVVLLGWNRTDLFVDEAQYWLWGQELAFGYYSKPPMIGWVIRGVTELTGSDAAFWIRLPGPLFHGATALILGAVAAHLAGARAALVVALGYVTLPMVALASLLISTDTIMVPFLALALWGWLVLLERRSAGLAVLTGVALGLAFLSKYAAIYYLLCAGLAAVLVKGSWPGGRAAGLVLVAFAVTISPNILWNALNGFTTVQHTLDNADWVRDPAARAGLNFAGLAEFFAAQFAVIGPVLFGGLVCMVARWRGLPVQTQRLLLFTVPIVLLVCGQALLSRAYANWAAAAYLAGCIAVLPWLPRVWLWVSFAVNGALCLALPLSTTVADTLTFGREQPALERYIGRAEMSRAIVAAARQAGVDTVVASHRGVLADLFYSARDVGLELRALAPEGRAPHHYALKFPYAPGDARVLLVEPKGTAHPCPELAEMLPDIAPERGAYRRNPQSVSVVPGSCLAR